jgi:prevent-host-death family protein
MLKEEHMADMAVSATQDEFATILNRVVDGKERIVLHRDGKPVAAVIPVEDLKLLERLIEEEEDRIDLARAERVLSDPNQEWIPWEQVKAEEGL